MARALIKRGGGTPGHAGFARGRRESRRRVWADGAGKKEGERRAPTGGTARSERERKSAGRGRERAVERPSGERRPGPGAGESWAVEKRGSGWARVGKERSEDWAGPALEEKGKRGEGGPAGKKRKGGGGLG